MSEPPPAVGFLLALVLMFFGGADARSQPGAPRGAETAQEIARQIFQRTVVIIAEDAGGRPTAIGSGFVVAQGVVATNWHVIRGSARGYIKFIGFDKRLDITGVHAIDPQQDLALLSAGTGQITPVRLADSDTTQVGDGVFVAGAPRGLEGTFSNGIVSGIRTVTGIGLIQITAPISPGSSGGPVLDQTGSVIGVAVATYRDGQNLNFAVPANRLRELVKKIGTPLPLAAAIANAERSSKTSSTKAPIASGVLGRSLTFDSTCEYGEFSLSLMNSLREPVQNVYALVIFYDKSNAPLDVVEARVSGVIMPGLAKRIVLRVDDSVGRLVTGRTGICDGKAPVEARTKVEIRVLNFEVMQ